MVSECMNPNCHERLHYLRDGRVVRIVHRDGEQTTVEHFWLCGACLEKYNFCFPADDQVSLIRRIEGARRIEAHAPGSVRPTLTLVA